MTIASCSGKPGDLFDSTEIDELTLRILAMTAEESAKWLPWMSAAGPAGTH
jgi:hypothetical protein